MLSIFVRRLLMLAALSAACSMRAQVKVNPATQINWPAVTGAGAPTLSCTFVNYGQPYTDTTNNAYYVCAATGWLALSSSTSSASFAALTTGSNTVAAMLVGTGASLSYSGSGVVNASELEGVAYAGTPAASYVPVATSSTAGVFRQLTQDDILPGFNISSFSGGSAVEIGTTVTNPSFTASYSTPPVSAQITNTDSIGSPLVLTTPFTSGTVTGSFVHTSAASVNFTLTAVASTTRTAVSAINWYPRVFGGVGAAGATSTITSSGTTAVLSTGAVLASAGLSNSQVGQNFGPYAPSNQYIYLLVMGAGHTFKDALTGFSLPFNSPTTVSFVNANGSTVIMYLYATTNSLNGTFEPEMTS